MTIVENNLTINNLLTLKTETTARIDSLTRDKIGINKQFPMNLEDQAIICGNDEVVELLDRQDRIELRSIDNAIKRQEAGTFGACTLCGEKITIKRLKAMPYATECIDCARS